MVVGAFRTRQGGFTLANLEALAEPATCSTALRQSIVLSAVTAVVGAVIGALLAYAVLDRTADGVLARASSPPLCGVLAQFGGVTLAFAFIATLRRHRLHHRRPAHRLGLDIHGGQPGSTTWDKGLMLVYLYFQIPLMVIVFLPARRRAAAAVAGGDRDPGRHDVDVLAPGRRARSCGPPSSARPCCCSPTRFSAYATAARSISQGRPLVPLQIDGALSSARWCSASKEVAKAMALRDGRGRRRRHVVYAVVDRRASRWLQR